MERIKTPSVAGKFYTKDKEDLTAQLNYFSRNNRKDYDCSARAVIVPHAGYLYSGQIASEGIQYLNKNAKNIFVIALAHFVPVQKFAVSTYDKWSTPLGEIELNQDINRELVEKFGCEYRDDAFVEEHSAEVQIPFIQTMLNDVKIIPILVSGAKYNEVTELIEHFWENKDNAFVISSDLSHFYSSIDAQKIDNITADMIETNSIENFNPRQACNANAVFGLVNFAKNHNYSLIRVDMCNSGDITGDIGSVVGYGSWILFEGEKTEFIKDSFSDLSIDISKKSILSGLEKQKLPKPEDFPNLPSVFDEKVACFVTLEKSGELRGCIGSILAHQPLILDLIKNSHNSAFKDPRFLPLKMEEFDDLSISISLLSTPEKMNFVDEEDLLRQIVPFEDGLIISDGGHQAVYLPSVWEQLPEKDMFLNSLKIKAGLSPKYFSKTFEAYKFQTKYITS